MEPTINHPSRLSPAQHQAILSSILHHVQGQNLPSPPLDSDLQALSTFYSSLPNSIQAEINSNLSSTLELPIPLPWLLQQQAYINSAITWSPYTSLTDDYRVQGANKSGGFSLLDPIVVTKIRSVGTEILKQLGKKILSGNFNLTHISFPIRCMQASTVLQNTLKTFQMIPLYITRAVATKDPLERLKLVIVSTLSSFVNTSTFEKPLNPILGETQHGLLEDGTQLYSEQISHHPPVSSFFIEGNLYKIYGYFNYTAKAGLNSVTVSNIGKRTFEFFDGYKAVVSCPEELFSGTFFGTMRHESLGTMQASDNEGHTCLISIGKIKGKPSDYLEGQIRKEGSGTVSMLTGTYLGYLEFDGVRYWDERTVNPFSIKYTQTLDSDSESRKDIKALRTGDINYAQQAKEELEDLQRLDRKLRGKNS